MRFHPDQNLPDCMIPDGGDCCAGHAAVCEDWHNQRAHIDALKAALQQIANKKKLDAVAAVSMQAIARAAIAEEQDK